MRISDFEKKGLIDIIRYIKKHPDGVQKTDLRDTGLSPRTSVKLLDFCWEEGLLELKPDLNRHLLVLSLAGQKLYSKIEEFDKFLQDIKKK